MAKKYRAFIDLQEEGRVQPVKTLKFAVINDEQLITSAVWSVFPSHNPTKPDIYVTASGFQGNAKFSFHRDILNYSWNSDAFARLVEAGIASAGSRHTQQLPIAELPWHGLTLRLVPELLSKKGHAPEDYGDGTIIALPPIREGMVLEIGFLLAEGFGLNVRGAQAVLGQVVSGGRALVVVLRFVEHDAVAFKQQINDALKRITIPDSALERLNETDDYAMHLFGQDGGALTVAEVHNVKFNRTKDAPQPTKS
jgi:hypothetical protein